MVTTTTRRPARAPINPMAAAVVVFPTPPGPQVTMSGLAAIRAARSLLGSDVIAAARTVRAADAATGRVRRRAARARRSRAWAWSAAATGFGRWATDRPAVRVARLAVPAEPPRSGSTRPAPIAVRRSA